MNLVLIAGMPATGKSHFAEYLKTKMNVPLISKDAIKEILFDTIGFRNHAEKTKLNIAALQVAYSFAGTLLEQGTSLILENNFENDAKPGLKQLINRYPCHVATVFFAGDPRILYERYVKRNADPARHRGHVLSSAYPERENIGYIPLPIAYEEFAVSFKERGMADPPLSSNVIWVDTTDFAAVNYTDIVKKLDAIL